MNITDAKNIINAMNSHLFVNLDLDKISEYYHSDVIQHCNDEDYEFGDLKSRIDKMNEFFEVTRFIQLTIFEVGEKIVYNISQIGFDKKRACQSQRTITSVVEFKASKIIQEWVSFNELLLPDVSNDEQNINILKQRFSGLTKNGKLRPLSTRQAECLYYYVLGFSAKEIGRRLELSFRTVQNYLNTIKEKLSCETSNELKNKVKSVINVSVN